MTKRISYWRYLITATIIIAFYITYSQFFDNAIVPLNEQATTTQVLSNKAIVTPKPNTPKLGTVRKKQPEHSTDTTSKDKQLVNKSLDPENQHLAIRTELTNGLSSHENQTYSEKLAYEQALLAELMAMSQDAINSAEQNGENIAELSATLLSASKKMADFVKDEDWQGYLVEVEKLAEINTNSLDTVMILALTNEVPPEIIKELLHLGANFDENSISLAAKSLEYVDALTELGLDIHQVSFFGKNAVSSAINNDSAESFNYFVEQGVSIKPSPYGLDPLDDAIAYAVLNSGDTYFAKKLIALGAPIEHSHKEALKEQQTAENSDIYVKLINDLPELLE
jgi:hypothetical protein